MTVRRRTRLAVLAATAVLGATVPVLGGATSAWACGDDQPAAAAPAAAAPAAAAPADAPAAAPAVAADPKPAVGLLPREATTVTAGGDPVEFGVEVFNGGTEAIKGIQPFPTFANEGDDVSNGDTSSVLHPEDLVLEVAKDGVWKTVPLKYGCDASLRGDYGFLATDLEPIHASRFMFRLSVTPHSTAAQKQVDIRVGAKIGSVAYPETVQHFTLPIVHPGAPTAPEPTATSKAPSTPAATPSAPATPEQTPADKDNAAPAVVPAALTSSTAPSPAAVPVAAQNLASTGGGSSSTPMLLGGTTLVLLGAGAVAFAARRRSAARRG
ncbi:hypothetical protein ACIQF6_09480 [Kitasatospora sp. NPDC092948]|uniref:hypothetical protein n=1 Tax=Kitasatospora sp. NPDC092948 TaxID=3364088 RepID=UPI003803E03A